MADKYETRGEAVYRKQEAVDVSARISQIDETIAYYNSEIALLEEEKTELNSKRR